jgi:hypothetical protein
MSNQQLIAMVRLCLAGAFDDLPALPHREPPKIIFLTKEPLPRAPTPKRYSFAEIFLP